MPDARLSVMLYRCLLRLYPTGFRENYARAVEREFCDELAECKGPLDFVALWIRLVADLAVSIPVQFTNELRQDVRFTLRIWACRPWHTAFAIGALAIGIGATTGVFSVVNARLLRALPFQEPERLVRLREFIPPHDTSIEFHQWRQQSAYLDDAALFEEFDVNLGGTGRASRVHATQTSGNFFSVLGSTPVLGRGFAPQDDVNGTGWGTPGRNAVAVIGYGLWQDLFGGDRNVLGTTIRIDGVPLTIIGVAPPGFDYPGKTVLWKPAAFRPENNGWSTVARLKSGTSWQQARAAFDLEAGRLSQQFGRVDKAFPPASMSSLQDALAGPVKKASLTFMVATCLVLLLACTNIANLLIARTADRAPELSIRSALGASRGRLIRQLVTECFLLSFAASLAGLTVAYWTSSLAAKVEPPALGSQSYCILDGRVLAFTAFVCIATTLICSILPVRYMGRTVISGSRSLVAVRSSRWIRESLVGAQVMLTVVFLASSVSLAQGLLKLMKIDRGYDAGGLVTVSVSLEGTTHQLEKHQLPYFENVLDRLRKVRGVLSASATEFLPLYATAFIGGPFGMDGRAPKGNSGLVPVLSGYFQTMGGRVLYGREFTDAEVHSAARVAVVNERFASGYGAPKDAIGHQLTIGKDASWKIIGVVRGMEYGSDSANGNQVFIPSAAPGSFFSTFVVRVDGRAEDHLAAIRDTIQSVDPEVPLFGAKTMEQRLDEAFVVPKFYRTAVWFFAGFALLLAVIGVYGIVSHTITQRKQELGVRMALGTTPEHLRAILLKRELLVVLASAVLGIAGAQLTGHLLRAIVDGARPAGLVTSVSVLFFLAAIASASVWSATRPIVKMDIVAILRNE